MYRMKLFLIMLFYAALTFFVAPLVTQMYLAPRDKHALLYGMIWGFVVSVLLWINVGSKLVAAPTLR